MRNDVKQCFYLTAIIIIICLVQKHPKRSQENIKKKNYSKLCQQVSQAKRIMKRQLNSNTKMKRRQQKKIVDLGEGSEAQYLNDENIAAQNLFNISHYQDELTQKKQLNPEADIFNSVQFQAYPPTHNLNLMSTSNYVNITQSKLNSSHLSDLQNFIDNKFIQQSRQLLKLYDTHANSNISPPANKTNFRQYKTKNDQAKTDLFSHSFKSECVFVIKRIPLNKQNVKKNKTTIKSEQSSPTKNHKHGLMTISKQKGNSILRISPLLQTLKRQENWLSKSFKISNEKSQKRISFAEFSKIQNYKTFSSFKILDLKPQNNRRVKTIVDHHQSKSLKKVINQYNKPSIQQRDTTSFRKRLTFYKNQRNKQDKRRICLFSR